MFLTILPNNDDLNGAKLPQWGQTSTIFFILKVLPFSSKLIKFTKLFYIFVVSLSYDASCKNDTSLLKINEMA